MRTIYLDGRYFKVDKKTIDSFAPGVFKAKGVFETMLGLDGMVLDMALHLKRLRVGLGVLGIKALSIDPSILTEVLRSNQLSLARVRLLVWQTGKQAHIMVAAMPLQAFFKNKYRVCLVQTQREGNDRLANVKSLDYKLFADAYAYARSKGFDEALLLNRKGYIFEASRANIFWSKDRVLYTPPLSSGCLNGITRRQVIQQSRKLKIPVKEKNMTPESFKDADAVFLTNSLIGIKPVKVPI